MRLRFLLVFLTLLPPLSPLSPRGNGKPFVIEYYYKTMGTCRRVLQLFKKNHSRS